MAEYVCRKAPTASCCMYGSGFKAALTAFSVRFLVSGQDLGLSPAVPSLPSCRCPVATKDRDHGVRQAEFPESSCVIVNAFALWGITVLSPVGREQKTPTT